MVETTVIILAFAAGWVAKGMRDYKIRTGRWIG